MTYMVLWHLDRQKISDQQANSNQAEKIGEA
jgi:hypothetical protein